MFLNRKNKNCPACMGVGHTPDDTFIDSIEVVDCPDCGGTGKAITSITVNEIRKTKFENNILLAYRFFIVVICVIAASIANKILTMPYNYICMTLIAAYTCLRLYKSEKTVDKEITRVRNKHRL